MGRPYTLGLAAFGQDGVEAVLTILRDDLQLTMKQMGTPSLDTITPAHVRAAGPSRASVPSRRQALERS